MLEVLRYRVGQARLLKEWRKWGERIAAASEKVLGECDVFVFGSVVEGESTGGSDVDVLIVSRNLPEDRRERAGVIARIEEEAGLPLYHPYEVHLVGEEEAKWYFKHITKYVKI